MASKSGKKAKRANRKNMLRKLEKNPNVLLHIGKTGGTTLQRVFEQLKKEGYKNLPHKAPHWRTMASILNISPDVRVSFLIRDPLERFVSGFNSRLRAGRPDHARLWTTNEAISYTLFPSATELAEALSSTDERLKSAADFALESNDHLRRGYVYYFQSVAWLKEHEKNIGIVRLPSQVDTLLLDVLEPAQVSKETIAAMPLHAHAAPSPAKPLPKKIAASLRDYLEPEYEIFNHLVETHIKA